MWSLNDKGLAGVVVPTLAAAGAIGLLVGVLALGWYIVWQTNLKDLPIAQELMGKRKQSQAQKDKIAEEIREIKRVHRRRGPSLETARQASLSRRVWYSKLYTKFDCFCVDCSHSLTCQESACVEAVIHVRLK